MQPQTQLCSETSEPIQKSTLETQKLIKNIGVLASQLADICEDVQVAWPQALALENAEDGASVLQSLQGIDRLNQSLHALARILDAAVFKDLTEIPESVTLELNSIRLKNVTETLLTGKNEEPSEDDLIDLF